MERDYPLERVRNFGITRLPAPERSDGGQVAHNK